MLDDIGLFFQGIAIPFLQITVVFQLYQLLLTDTRASVNLYPIAAFLLKLKMENPFPWNSRKTWGKLWLIFKAYLIWMLGWKQLRFEE